VTWPTLTLENIVKISKGKKHNLVKSVTNNRYIQIDDLRNDNLIKFTDDDKGTFVEPSDVIIAWDGANAGTVGYGLEGLIGSTLARLKVIIPHIDTNYLGRFLQSKFKEIRNNCTGATIPHVSKVHLNSLLVPVPPLPIQKQIAAVLEKADNLRQQSQQMEQELNSLAQSVFLDMFGDPKSNPKRWQKRPLKSILEKLVGGKSLAAPEQHIDVSEYRVLKISAVTSGQYNPLESKALPADYIPPKEHLVQVNDLLISRANTTELVGATTMVFDTPENLLLPDKLWKFQWKESEPLSQIFMWKLLSSKAMRHRLSEISSGSGGSMKNISKSKLLELEIIFPDYEKQMEYENFYLRLRDQMLLNKEYISQAEGQFKSLMQRAFKGEFEIKDLA
tara:strand:- start:2009 stop:3181 length:1173 start_codon:yes stop_codon:yes gene_type:complete